MIFTSSDVSAGGELGDLGGASPYADNMVTLNIKIFGGISSENILVNLISPIDSFETIDQNITFNASATVVLGSDNLTNMTLFLYNSDGDLINNTETNTISGNTTNSSLFNFTDIDFGTYSWNVFGCSINSSGDTLCSFANSNFTFLINQFVVESQSFNTDVLETNNEFFQINVSTVENVLSLSAKLIYNGTPHQANTVCTDAGLCSSDVTIDIPLVTQGESENQSFFWEMSVFDGSSEILSNTTELQQNISRIHLEQCDGTFTIEALNFTAFDEQNITKISPYQFDGTFNVWLGTGDSTRNVSFSNNAEETVLCLTPVNATMKIDAQIDYGFSDDNTTYITRNYFFDNATISNETQHVPLFLLKNTESTTFILEVEALNLRGIPDSFIHTQRFYPGEGIFRTVQIGRTNEEGKTTGFFETETVDYKFLIIKNGQIIISTEQQKVVGESIPFTLVFRIGQTIDTPWSFYEGLDSLQKNLSLNRDTGIISFTYIDTSGSLSSARLFVTNQKYVEAPTTICDVSTILSSATLVCNVTGFNGTINAEAFIGRSPEVLVDLIAIVIDNARAVFGELGLLMGMLIIMVGYSVTVFSITAGLIIGFIILLFVSLTPLVSIPPLFVWGLAALTLFVIVAVNKR